MIASRFAIIAAVSALLAIDSGAACAQISGKKFAIPHSDLCVTEGKIETAPGDRLTVDAEKMRAYVNEWTPPAIETRFTYVGPTTEESRLGSGEVRRQFGLKLRAQNACNLVYVMWRFEPEAKIVVSVKRNPGQTTSSECGNRGYRNIKPKQSSPPPPIRPGDSHELGAEMRGTGLIVRVDGAKVWTGDVGADAVGLEGPVGIRSDNVRLTLDLMGRRPRGAQPDPPTACKSGPQFSD